MSSNNNITQGGTSSTHDLPTVCFIALLNKQLVKVHIHLYKTSGNTGNITSYEGHVKLITNNALLE